MINLLKEEYIIMQPNEIKTLYHVLYKDLPGVIYNPDERFIHARHRNGCFVNYAVSNYGRVFSFFRNIIMNQYVDERGYHRLEIRIGLNQTAYVGVHYLELMSFCPITNTDLYVPNHKDGNPSNNMLWNLEWMTISENTRHALDNGLCQYKGENNTRSILTNEMVQEICELLENNIDRSTAATYIMNKYNIDMYDKAKRIAIMNAIKNIGRGQTYLDISRNYNIRGINGKTDYEPEMTAAVCEILSKESITIEELCNRLNIPMEDRKMFLNYVRDITRGQKHLHILKQYPELNKLKGLPYNHPDYTWYY